MIKLLNFFKGFVNCLVISPLKTINILFDLIIGKIKISKISFIANNYFLISYHLLGNLILTYILFYLFLYKIDNRSELALIYSFIISLLLVLFSYLKKKKYFKLRSNKNNLIKSNYNKFYDKLNEAKVVMSNRYKSTAYFYNGLTIGNPLNINHGYGRWKIIIENKLISTLENKSVIDFGSNNCILPIYMLTEGKAKNVDCVELFDDLCEVGKSFKYIMEAQLNKPIKMKIINDNMYNYIKTKNFNYDLATFFCSLYYLEENQIIECIDILSKKVKFLLIQSNLQTTVTDRSKKSNYEFLKKIVEKNNFEIIDSYNYKINPRPLFLAKSKINE